MADTEQYIKSVAAVFITHKKTFVNSQPFRSDLLAMTNTTQNAYNIRLVPRNVTSTWFDILGNDANELTIFVFSNAY